MKNDAPATPLRAVFANRRMLITLATGFSSGLPLALTGSTLQAWMTDAKVDIKTIGLFSFVGLPYTLKFLWSPLLDHYVPNFAGLGRLGRRRGWMIVTQVGLMLAIAALAFGDPASAPQWLAVAALVIAFLSASQDIVIDAFRAELLRPAELGAGAGVHIMGYRIAMLTSGALAFILADHLPWRVVYLIMACLMSVGMATAWRAPSSSGTAEHHPRTGNLRESIVLPFMDFFRRPGALEILAFIILYKLGDAMAVSLTSTFLIKTGYSKTEIGAVTKVFGLTCTILGSLIGGAGVARWGLLRSLWIFGMLQSVGVLAFAWLATVPPGHGPLILAICCENLGSGMGNAAFVAFMMKICNQRFTATQFALISSLMAVARVIAAAPSGYLVTDWGWRNFFIASMLMAIPGLLLLLRYPRWAAGSAELARA